MITVGRPQSGGASDCVLSGGGVEMETEMACRFASPTDGDSAGGHLLGSLDATVT
jgi:hypothetical protein